MTTAWFTLIAAVLLIQSGVVRCQNSTKLLFLQILFRHGDRAPYKLYPNDPNPVEVWPEGLQKLTLLGKRQHYVLGKFFRSMYRDFVTSNPNEVLVNSTEADRCLRSAEANLMSFYAPTPEWMLEKNLNWQPIPIFYLPKEKDKYLSPWATCPRVHAQLPSIFAEDQLIFSEYQKKLRGLAVNSGISDNWVDYIFLYDTLFIERKYNLTIPTWVEPYWNDLEKFSDFVMFKIYSTAVVQRLRAGPFLQKVIENMNNKVAGALPQLKVNIFSAHDVNLIAVLQALKLYNMKRPQYCATLIFELHQGKDGEKMVRLLYLNSTTPEDGSQTPHVLTLDGCTEFCPLSYFIHFTKTMIPENWEEECQIDGPLASDASGMASSFSGFLTFFYLKVALGLALQYFLSLTFR